MQNVTSVQLKRDCPAVQIPAGTATSLPAGTPVEETVREASRRRGVNAEVLLRLLSANAPPAGRSATAFLDALNQLAKVPGEPAA